MAFSADISETLGNVGNRTTAQGYNKPDEIRNQYTGYEHDDESGLDFAQTRYYNSSHGRFTSIDPLTASISIKEPQTFNRYTYAMNSPYKFTDPSGLIPIKGGGEKGGLDPCEMGVAIGGSCGNAKKRSQTLDLPDDLNKDISRKTRKLFESGDWAINRGALGKILLDISPEVDISKEMMAVLFEDATTFYNRGVEEERLYLAAMEQIRANTQQLEDWNASSQFGTEPLFTFSGEVGSEICIGNRNGGCDNSNKEYTRTVYGFDGSLFPLSKQMLRLDFSAVREYNA